MIQTVFLLPGQGCYRPGAFAGRFDPELAEVFDAVDHVAAEFGHEPVSSLLRNPDGPSAAELGRADSFALQLAIYAAGLAWYRLAARTQRPDVLAGHSMGEIAALTAAGAFDVADGARLICHRSMALLAGATQPGGMVALGLNARRAAALVELVDEPGLALAVLNSPGQTVVSGSEAGLAATVAVATGLRASATRLSSPFAYHSPLLAGVGLAFATAAAGIRQRPLMTRVFSPVAGRYLDDRTDAKGLLADQLTRSVDFLTAIRELHADGASVFVECGQAGLSKLVQLTVPGVTADSVQAIEIRAVEPAGFATAGVAPGLFGSAGGGLNGFGSELPRYLDQPATAQPFTGQPVFGQAVFGHAAAAQPVFGQAPAAQPVSGQPMFGQAPAAQPVFGQPVFGQAPAAQPVFGQAPAAQPVFGQAVFGQAPAAQPVFGQAPAAQPVFGQAPAAQPVFGQPVFGTPGAMSQPPAGLPPVTVLQPATVPAADQALTPGRPGTPDVGAAGPTDPAAVAEVLAELLSLYASSLGYPQEAILADADLEADLGIDSLKRAEMLGKVRAHFGLTDSGDDGRFLTQSTLGELAELVTAAR